MDYFNDVFTTFLGPWKGQKARRFHQKYLNLCSEDVANVLRGLKRHEAEELMTEFPFLGELSL